MKKVTTLTALATIAAGARTYLKSRSAIAEVAEDLRSPFLPLLSGSTTAWNLPIYRLAFRLNTSPGPGVIATTQRVKGRSPVDVVICRPAEPGARRRPGVLSIHGGGMVSGSSQVETLANGRRVRELDAVVVSPKYRLAPEHPFPAALDDCMTTLAWMRDHAEELGIDPDRIAVTGSSAGGGLAAAVAQRAHDEGIVLRAQALAYPMLDDRTVLRDNPCGRGKFIWTPKSNRFAWTAYLGRQPRFSDAPPYAAPARRTDLSGLAPAWIGVGGLDLFYDECVAYAEALRASGVPCELVTVAGMYHGADGLAPKAPAIREFARTSTEHLSRHLADQ